MARTGRPLAAALGVLIVGFLVVAPRLSSQAPSAFPSTSNGEWTHYTADVRGTKYSPLDQINAANFNKLEVAWRFKTESLGPRPEYKLEGTPLMIKGVIYTTGGTRRSVVALDAKTGELLWHVNLGGPNASGPISYAVDGKQYVVGTGQGSMFIFGLPE